MGTLSKLNIAFVALLALQVIGCARFETGSSERLKVLADTRVLGDDNGDRPSEGEPTDPGTPPTPTPTSDIAKATSLTRKAGGLGPPDGVCIEIWNGFCKQRKKALTDIAYTRMLATLAECAEAGWAPSEIVGLSIEKSWETLYVPTERRNGNGTANGRGRPHNRADEIDDAMRDLGFAGRLLDG